MTGIRTFLLILCTLCTTLTAADSVTVRARLLDTAKIPSAEDLGTYTEGLVIFRWRVEDVVEGELEADEILVSHYGVFDTLKQSVANWKPGLVRTLDVVPFDQAQGIQILYASDPSADDYDTQRFHHQDQTVVRTIPEDARFDYGHKGRSNKVAMAVAFHEQLRLASIGDSQVNSGIDPALLYPLENQIGPVAVNLAVRATGLPYINTLLRDYLVHAPQLSYLVVGLNSRMFNVAEKGGDISLDVRDERVAESPGYQADRKAGTDLFAPAPNFITFRSLPQHLWNGWSPSRHAVSQYGFNDRGFDGKGDAAVRKSLNQNYPDGGTAESLPEMIIAEDAKALLVDLIHLCAEHDITLVGFTPPINPLINDFPAAMDEDNTTRAGHERLLAWWRELDEAHDAFRFLDINQAGGHDFPSEFFHDVDHLLRPGATLLSARIAEALMAPDPVEPLAFEQEGALIRARHSGQDVRWIISDGSVASGRSLTHRLPRPGHYLIAARWQDEQDRLRYAAQLVTVGEDVAVRTETESELKKIDARHMRLDPGVRIAPDGSGRVLLDAVASKVEDGPRFVHWQLPDGKVRLGLATEITLPSGKHDITATLFDIAGHRLQRNFTVTMP